MFHVIRWTTIHPALVHVPIGVLPLMFLAYAIGAARHSERWLFAGDVAAGFAAVVTTVAAAFGVVSYLTVSWPGGLGPWPVVHLVLGITATVALIAFALRRWGARRIAAGQDRPRAARWMFGAGFVTLLALAAGYVGGELLVYHGGIAVQAAGQGALAPPLSRSSAPPHSMQDAMQRLRPAWALAVTTTAEAVVEHPSKAHYDRVAQSAQSMQLLARWVRDWGEGAESEAADSEAHANKKAGDEEHGIKTMAETLRVRAQQLEQAANRHDLPATADALGAISETCADCHVHERWKSGQRGQNQAHASR